MLTSVYQELVKRDSKKHNDKIGNDSALWITNQSNRIQLTHDYYICAVLYTILSSIFIVSVKIHKRSLTNLVKKCSEV